MKLNDSLHQSLRAAISETDATGLNEEQGGFILKKDNQFAFHLVRNSNTGTPRAVGLYTADKNEMGKKVLTNVMAGWDVYASFHTHPKGFPAMPSTVDIRELFTGHPTNFIYAPQEKTLNRFTLETDDSNGDRFWSFANIEL